MLFEVIGQGWIFLIILWFGCIAAILDDINNVIFIKTKNEILKNIFEIYRILLIFIIFIFSYICFGYAELRFYYIFAFLIGFWLEKKFFQNLVAKTFKIIYNLFVNIFRWFKKYAKKSNK